MIKTKILCNICTASILTLLSFSSLAINRMPDFQTTRLKSTGGAGVGSLLVDEATALNPAPLAFFGLGSFYLQKMFTKSTYSDSNTSPNGPGEKESDMTSIIATDTKGRVKGSLRYLDQDYLYNSRKQYALSMAHMAGKSSSFGITYKMTKDEISNDGINFQKEKYNQTTFGASHVLNNNFSFGIIFVDPFKVKAEQTRGIAGIQYVYQDFLSFMLDGGADYNKKLSETVLWKTAMQIKFYDDFYIRAGIYDDRGLMEKGSGAGIGWLQPKLNIELALVNRRLLQSEKLNQLSEDIKETSFSLGYRF